MKPIPLLFSLLLPIMPLFAHEGEHSSGASLAETENLQTGSGLWRYKTVPGWAKLPEGKSQIGPLHGGIAIDKAGLIYVSSDTSDGIHVFEKSGEYKKSIAAKTAGIHSLQIVTEDGSEFIYAAHLKGQRILKLDLEGNILLSIKHTEEQPIPGTLKGLTAVAAAPDGSLYAAVGYGSNMIHKFDQAGELLKSFGGRGAQKGKFRTCHGITIDQRYEGGPRLLVCDRENRRLVHLTLDGEYIGNYAKHLRRPCSVSILKDKCVVAELQGKVTIIDKTGAAISFLGDNPDTGQWANFGVPLDKMKKQFFTAPHGVSFDADGNVFVQDWNSTGRVTKLEKLANPEPTPRPEKKKK